MHLLTLIPKLSRFKKAYSQQLEYLPGLSFPILNFELLKTSISLLLLFKAQWMLGLAAISLSGFVSDRVLAAPFPSASVTEPVTEAICPAQLGTAIEAITNRPQFRRARWGILIEPLSSHKKNLPLYRRDAERYFIPASNVKLLTTAAALLALGSDFRIRTSIYDEGAGTLRVVGRGDPSLMDTQLRELAQQLKRQGVRNIKHLIIDESEFQGERLHPNWEWEDVQFYYGASVNSLILNQNTVELKLSPHRVGEPLQMSWSDVLAQQQWRIKNESVASEAGTTNSVSVTGILGQPVLQVKGQLAIDSEPVTFGLTILDPTQYFLQHFRRVLAEEGIPVEKASVITQPRTNNQRELAAIESPPLTALIGETNQESNNLYAEVLLRTLQVSAKNHSSSNLDSAAVGLQQLKATLTTLGVDPESYVLVDGSGLSRHNLVSPSAIAQTLQLMAQTPQARIYRASLPVAGVSGTLKNRVRDTAAQGRVQAKTGGMTGVSALSGYLDIPGYQPLVFSIIVNQSDQSFRDLRQAIDEIVLVLTRLHSC